MANKLIDSTILNYFKQQLDKFFVKQVSGKGLSTNDYTSEEKTKLSGIASGAQANVIESVKVNGTALSVTSKAVNVTVPTKTSQLTNDSTYVKKSEIPTQVSEFNNDMSYVTANNIIVMLKDYALKSDVSSMYKYKGSVDSYDKLPTSGQTAGDSYNVKSADSSHGIRKGDNVVWTGTEWDVLSGTVDLSGYMDKTSYTIATSTDIDSMFTS
mgnify:CR=1 FL=1